MNTPDSDHPQLPVWAQDLIRALELPHHRIDAEQLATLAQQIPETQSHPRDRDHDTALLGFLAGYAAGLAEGTGQADFARAHRASTRFIGERLAQTERDQE